MVVTWAAWAAWVAWAAWAASKNRVIYNICGYTCECFLRVCMYRTLSVYSQVRVDAAFGSILYAVVVRVNRAQAIPAGEEAKTVS